MRTEGTCQKPYDLRFMLQMIDAEFGTKTDKATTRLVREFVGNTKSPAEDITTFNRKFSQTVETLSGSDMPLPETFLVNLYLVSLGFPYRAVEATAAALPRDKRALAKVMSLAKDHTVHSGGEVDMKDKALLAIIRNIPKHKFEAALQSTIRNNKKIHRQIDLAIVMVCGTTKRRVLTRGVGWPTSIRNRDDNICKTKEKHDTTETATGPTTENETTTRTTNKTTRRR